MKAKIEIIEIHMVRGIGCHAQIWRKGKSSSEYMFIKPASFARLQRAQAAMMKRMFGRVR